MIPNKKMLRYHDEIGFYELSIPKDAIEFYREKFHKDGKEGNLNINHLEKINFGVQITDSFLISDVNRLNLPETFKGLPDGTWMIEYTFETIELLRRFEDEGITGFSVEGRFVIEDIKGKKYTIYENFKRMNKLSDLLPFDLYVFGGSTDGAGRNEHGEAHFELKEKNTRKSLGKIFMPNMENWVKSSSVEKLEMFTVNNGPQISKKEKIAIVRWLELNENENLKNCHKFWNESNQYNNRTIQI